MWGVLLLNLPCISWKQSPLPTLTCCWIIQTTPSWLKTCNWYYYTIKGNKHKMNSQLLISLSNYCNPLLHTQTHPHRKELVVFCLDIWLVGGASLWIITSPTAAAYLYRSGTVKISSYSLCLVFSSAKVHFFPPVVIIF